MRVAIPSVHTIPKALLPRFLLVALFVAVSVFGFAELRFVLGYSFVFIVLLDVAIVVAGLAVPFLFGISKLPYWGFLYLVVVFSLAEEILVNAGSFSPFGIALSFVGLFGFTALGAVIGEKSNDLRVVLEISGLLFVMRIVLSSLPARVLSFGLSLPLSYTLIMTVIVIYVIVRKIPIQDTKLFTRGTLSVPLQVLIGASVGVVLGLVQYFVISSPEITTVAYTPLSSQVYVAVTELVFVAITEELLFRGLLLSFMNKIVPKWVGVNLSSLIFAIFHIGYLSPVVVLFAYFIGIIFALLMIRTNSLASPILAHGVSSVVLLSLAPILMIHL